MTDSLRERVDAAFERIDNVGDVMRDQVVISDAMPRKDSVEQIHIEVLVLAQALRTALAEIAADIDKLTAAQTND